MEPYYQDGSVTIYHGDALEIAPALGLRAVITDPPYGVSEPTNRKERGRTNLAECNDFPPVHGDDEPFDPTPWLTYERIVLFGANHYADRLPPSAAWFVWDKRDGIPSNDNADCELAWTNLPGPARLYRHMWNGMVKASERDQRRVHPTQKPVALMEWVLQRAALSVGTILDPYMGSGATLRAAKNLGVPAVGIEISEQYCEVAARRMAQEALDFAGMA